MHIRDTRRLFLQELEHVTHEDHRTQILVEWLGPGDALGCCDLCDRRAGQRYSLPEIDTIVRGKFCRPRDRVVGCRCSLVFFPHGDITPSSAEAPSADKGWFTRRMLLRIGKVLVAWALLGCLLWLVYG